ncbi:hypothetical protein E2C01_019183 [Portunus trituberculatus]|uniref:Uncharacterized protein n=1 Tax=Portunus trituberculatus TaxID=210409 RepID=A0A5B7DYJ6_PORTR|nr:hypothetical protein [Portunus trituberculatus]
MIKDVLPDMRVYSTQGIIQQEDVCIRIKSSCQTDSLLLASTQVDPLEKLISKKINSSVILTLTLTLPLCFSISPRIAEQSEDLPAPTAPTTATREPFSTVMLTPLSTGFSSPSLWPHEKAKNN